MKTFRRILFFALLFRVSSASAQRSPYDVVSATRPSLYESLQASHFIRPQISFRIYGNVKEICETTTLYPKEGGEQLLKTAYYEFSPGQRLTLYLEDTVKSLKNSNARIEKYFFEGEYLFKVEKYSGIQQNASKTTTTFDRDGFVIKEVFERYDAWSRDIDPKFFNYKLDYYWNDARDTVKMKYTYETEKTSYQRFADRTQSFVQEKKAPNQPDVAFLNPADLSSERAVYDDRGNLIQYWIFDNTIKNSYNINQFYEYRYNEKNDLTEVAFSTSGPHGADHYELVYRHKISRSGFDAKENWTTQSVTDEAGNKYVFRREITYY